jgi:hypothetical protein
MFIRGAVDSYFAMNLEAKYFPAEKFPNAKHKTPQTGVCFPEGTMPSLDEIRNVVLAKLRANHPETNRMFTAGYLLFDALRDKWPCSA